MQGHQAFFPLARNAAVAAGGLVLSLRTFGSTLSGVWCSFAVFNAIRFAGAFRHHLVTGPLGSRARKAAHRRQCFLVKEVIRSGGAAAMAAFWLTAMI